MESFAGYPGDYAVIEQDNLKGLINSNGKVLISPQYEDMGWTSGSQLVVEGIIGYKSASKWGLVSINNDQLTQAKYNTIEILDNDLIIASQPGSTGLQDYYGLINVKGKEVISFKYISLKGAGDQIIAITKSGNDLLYGLVDKKEKIIIPFIYTKIEQISPEIFALKDEENKIHLSNTEGYIITPESIDEVIEINGNLIVIKKDGKTGLLNTDGEVLLETSYKKINIDADGSTNSLKFTEWSLIDTMNNEICKFHYDEIESVNQSIFKVRMNKGDAFIDKEGVLQGFPGRVNIVKYLEDFAIFKDNNKYGIMDYKGNVILGPDYTEIVASDPLLFLCSNESWSIVHTRDFNSPYGSYDNLNQLSDNFICMELNGFWGLLSEDGEILLEAKYDSILEIRDNFIKVLFYGETGVVDISGNWKILPQKANIEILPNNKFLISSVDGSTIEQVNGTVLYRTDNLLSLEGESFIEEDWNGYLGMVNSKYEKILPVDKDSIITLIEDSLYFFLDEYGWGSVLENGRILFEHDERFQEVFTENEGYIGVKIDGKYGFIDNRGRLRISNRYEGIGYFHNGMAPVKIINNWGYVDMLERIVVQPHFELVFEFHNGLAIVSKDEKYGLIDSTGYRITEIGYNSILRTSYGSFILKYGDKYGLADDKGHLKLFPKFETLSDLGNGYIITKRKDKNGLISVKGVTIIPQIYDKIVYDQYSRIYICGKKSKWETHTVGGFSTKQ